MLVAHAHCYQSSPQQPLPWKHELLGLGGNVALDLYFQTHTHPTRSLPHVCGGMPTTHKLLHACLIIRLITEISSTLFMRTLYTPAESKNRSSKDCQSPLLVTTYVCRVEDRIRCPKDAHSLISLPLLAPRLIRGCPANFSGLAPQTGPAKISRALAIILATPSGG
jgi:hypothetical protein